MNGLFAGQLQFFFDEIKLQLALLGEDAVENDLDAVAGAKAAARCGEA